MNTLDQIERQIRALFESASSILPWADQNAVMVHKLCETIQTYYADTSLPPVIDPPQFLILVNPVTYVTWLRQNEWEGILVEAIMSTVAELGYQYMNPPEILTRVDESITPGDAKIIIREEETLQEKTSNVALSDPQTNQKRQDVLPGKPILILKNEKVIFLQQPVINLGRKSTNHIILNDLKISRLHAQIRRVADGYMIFDVGSTGGTFVNGNRISQHKLQPGDVISLAGYPIIFAEDQTGSTPVKKTKPSEIPLNTNSEMDQE